MSVFKITDHHIVYENPEPTFTSRHAYFPGMVRLPSGELLAMFRIGQAFESPDNLTFIARSSDAGRTWTLQGRLHPRERRGLVTMKPTVLHDGSLIAVGYSFFQTESGRWINKQTGGLPEGTNLISTSRDEGRTWTRPRVWRHSSPEVLEVSGPCIALHSGDLLALGTPMPRYDGTTPSGHVGVALRSSNRGRTWRDDIIYYDNPPVGPYEARVCQLEDGRIVAIIWALDTESGTCHNNQVIVSHDDGFSWSDPIDTGVSAQASNVMALDGDRLLSVHAHREAEPVGVFVRLVDFAGDRWNVLSEACVWGKASALKVSGFQDMGGNLLFGQPSVIEVARDEYLAYHWSIEAGQGRIVAHRFRLASR